MGWQRGEEEGEQEARPPRPRGAVHTAGSRVCGLKGPECTPLSPAAMAWASLQEPHSEEPVPIPQATPDVAAGGHGVRNFSGFQGSWPQGGQKAC